MTTWTPATTKPGKSGEVYCRFGVTGDVFWALWNHTFKCFTNFAGEPIIFGDRDVAGDVWCSAPPRRREENA